MEKCLSTLLCFLLITLFTACGNSNALKDTKQRDKLTVNSKSLLKYTSGIRAILEDKEGSIWFGSHNEGICKFDGKEFTYFTKENSGLANNQVRSIYEDANGVIWFECGEGISSYKNGELITNNNKNYISRNEWQLTENNIWFKGNETNGTNANEGDYGVYRYDGEILHFHIFPLNGNKNDGSTFASSTPFVNGVNGKVWFGTYGAVIGYNGEDFTIIDNESLGLKEETGYLHVRSIFEDSKGKLWIGNNGIGVLLYDGNTTVNFSEENGLISENSLKSGGYNSPAGSLEHVFSIGEDKYGNMWFGDRDTGAWKYDGKTFKNYTAKDGLTTPHIWQIYNAQNGELWFALGDGNVLKFNGNSFEKIF